ncbi:MAG: hypothetical protein R6U11_07710 [Bacteroidales bacterium]
MIKRIMLYILILVSLVCFVAGEAPFNEAQTSDKGLQFTYPKIFYHEKGEYFNMDFHLFNSSSLPVYKANCTLHIYGDNKEELLDVNMLNPEGHYFFYNVSGEIFSYEGEYQYSAWCNSSEGEGGFFSTEIVVVENSVKRVTNTATDQYTGIAFMLIMSIALFLGAFALALKLQVDGGKASVNYSRDQNWKILRRDGLVKVVMLFMYMLCSMLFTGFTYITAQSISTGMQQLVFGLFILNLVGFMCVFIYAIFQLTLFPIGIVVDYYEEKKREM